MSASQSNLSMTGFDYVVAVTQDSINGTLEEYLYGGLPEAILCYVYDAENNPVAIDYATFVRQANNTDPFSVPDGTASSDLRVQALNNASFAFAIRAKLGLPPGVLPANIPPIVVLKPGQSNVTYTLMFSEFIATEIVFGPRGSMTWVNQSQPFGTSWTFSGAVDLNFQDAAFANLPASGQKQLKDIDDQDEFSVQQLYYDLNSSDLEQGFQFNNVPSNSTLNTFMTSNFINTYWKALGGAEVLGYGVKHLTATSPSSLAVTDLNFFTPDAVGNEGAPLTLNYLCATNNDSLPDTTHAGFGWNWIEPGEVSQYDGVAALNRNTFAQYLNNALWNYVSTNCYATSATATADFPGADLSFNMTSGQSPTVTYPPSGATILSYSYESDAADQAGHDGILGRIELNTSFSLTVSVQGNQMVIVQQLVVYLYVRSGITEADGNVVDKQITDTYTFGVDDQGQIVVTNPSASATPPTSVIVDNSTTPGVNGFLNFWTHINEVTQDVAQWAQKVTLTNLRSIPASAVQNFIFPGGATFSFADVTFSDNQDLVSHITYTEPS
jgi:hypothetical protein